MLGLARKRRTRAILNEHREIFHKSRWWGERNGWASRVLGPHWNELARVGLAFNKTNKRGLIQFNKNMRQA